MSRYTAAYTNYISRLAEIEILIKSVKGRSLEYNTSSERLVNAVCRSSVVLLSSHIEGYFKDLGVLALEKMVERKVPKSRLQGKVLYYLSKQIIDEISETKDPEKLSQKISGFLSTDAHIWLGSEKFTDSLNPEAFNLGFSNPTHQKIKQYLSRFGYSDFYGDLGRKLTRERAACVNMIDHVVDTRNKIAHGDTSVKETPNNIEAMIELTKKYCRASDDCFAKWCSKKICCIR